TIEGQLLQLLLEAAPQALPAERQSTFSQSAANRELSGPVVNPEGRTDVVTSQQDVDDLLSSLGF
ncbi:MAG TPA: protein phosphatase CheZ, partial [bacterium]|nr:protein phosphatase CheZ [bacterium]